MKTKRGRPPLDASEAKGLVYQLRLTEAEREQFENAATKAGLKLSAWMRERLTKAATRESKRD
jgi:hypothetical protein